MAARSDTKTRMVDSAITLLRERGAAGVTIDSVLEHSGAPRGSVYHHFPGGRNELVMAAARTSAAFITHGIERSAAAGQPADLLQSFAEFWKRTLEDSDYRAGCPVVAIAADGRDDQPEVDALVSETFAAWRDCFAACLGRAGASPEGAAELATLVVCSVEGAVLMCRSERSTRPLDDVIALLKPMVSSTAARR